ncbi:hypothetical protein [Ruegeria lacuscaerulensis]|uniref:hypothetical protein n=1 Tax=Ruegeria lacuscaerulensis TaxID=55218 RepID=UPI00147B2C8F|nr:hypothetical protein [Ruegeria lacuscaerulensis]
MPNLPIALDNTTVSSPLGKLDLVRAMRALCTGIIMAIRDRKTVAMPVFDHASS